MHRIRLKLPRGDRTSSGSRQRGDQTQVETPDQLFALLTSEQQSLLLTLRSNLNQPKPELDELFYYVVSREINRNESAAAAAAQQQQQQDQEQESSSASSSMLSQSMPLPTSTALSSGVQQKNRVVERFELEDLFYSLFKDEFTVNDFYFIAAMPKDIFDVLVDNQYHWIDVCSQRGGIVARVASDVPTPTAQLKAWVYGKSISTYPYNNREKNTRDGDPICDWYSAVMYENRTIFAVADGCNWGPPPREAAQRASANSVRYLYENQHKVSNISDAALFCLRAMMVAHSSIFKGKEYPSDAGGTTLVCGMILEVDSSYELLTSHQANPSPTHHSSIAYVAVLASVGDCKTFMYSNAQKRVIDITMGQRDRSGGDAKDSGGRIGFKNEGFTPDLDNLQLIITPLQEGDYLMSMSDGVHDNLDPCHLGALPPQHIVFAHQSEKGSALPTTAFSETNTVTPTTSSDKIGEGDAQTNNTQAKRSRSGERGKPRTTQLPRAKSTIGNSGAQVISSLKDSNFSASDGSLVGSSSTDSVAADAQDDADSVQETTPRTSMLSLKPITSLYKSATGNNDTNSDDVSPPISPSSSSSSAAAAAVHSHKQTSQKGKSSRGKSSRGHKHKQLSSPRVSEKLTSLVKKTEHLDPSVTLPVSLNLRVVKARNLAPKDLNGLSDPYCVVYWLDTITNPKSKKRKTKVVWETLNPFWDHTFTFVWADPTAQLVVQCWDKDQFGTDDFEGEITVAVVDLVAHVRNGGPPMTRRFKLRKRDKDRNDRASRKNRVCGDIELSIGYAAQGSEVQKSSSFDDQSHVISLSPRSTDESSKPAVLTNTPSAIFSNNNPAKHAQFNETAAECMPAGETNLAIKSPRMFAQHKGKKKRSRKTSAQKSVSNDDATKAWQKASPVECGSIPGVSAVHEALLSDHKAFEEMWSREEAKIFRDEFASRVFTNVLMGRTGLVEFMRSRNPRKSDCQGDRHDAPATAVSNDTADLSSSSTSSSYDDDDDDDTSARRGDPKQSPNVDSILRRSMSYQSSEDMHTLKSQQVLLSPDSTDPTQLDGEPLTHEEKFQQIIGPLRQRISLLLQPLSSYHRRNQTKVTPVDIVNRAIEHAEFMTRTSRLFLENVRNKRLPHDYLRYPGKMDHTTILCFKIGTIDPTSLSSIRELRHADFGLPPNLQPVIVSFAITPGGMPVVYCRSLIKGEVSCRVIGYNHISIDIHFEPSVVAPSGTKVIGTLDECFSQSGLPPCISRKVKMPSQFDVKPSKKAHVVPRGDDLLCITFWDANQQTKALSPAPNQQPPHDHFSSSGSSGSSSRSSSKSPKRPKDSSKRKSNKQTSRDTLLHRTSSIHTTKPGRSSSEKLPAHLDLATTKSHSKRRRRRDRKKRSSKQSPRNLDSKNNDHDLKKSGNDSKKSGNDLKKSGDSKVDDHDSKKSGDDSKKNGDSKKDSHSKVDDHDSSLVGSGWKELSSQSVDSLPPA